MNEKGLGRDEIAQLLRDEAERIRRANEDQARHLRQELLDSQRGSQETMLTQFRELGQSLSHQSRRTGDQLNDALRAFETRVEAGLARLSSDFGALRLDLGAEGRRIVEALRTTASEVDAAGDRRQRALAEAIGAKFGHFGEVGAGMAGLRDELNAGLQKLNTRITEALGHLGVQQVTRLEQVSQSLRTLSDALAAAQGSQREALEASLDAMRQEAATMNEDLKRLKELETENARLRRAVADLTLDKITLNEALKTKR